MNEDQVVAIQAVNELLKAATDDNDAARADDNDDATKVLKTYSDFAAMCDPAEDECLGHYKFEEIAIDKLRDERDLRLQKGIVNFFVDLSARRLFKGAVSETADGRGQVASWEEYTEDDFLPDNTDFQRCVPEMKLWEFGLSKTRPEPEFETDVAFESIDFGVEDKGDVLWKLEAISSGFPVGGLLQGTNGISILREHHRQVMFNAFAWLLRNAASLGLTIENSEDPRPKSVVAAVCGSSGIGKSRSLIFLLWFLLKKESPFILEAGTEDNRYFCLIRPRAGTVKFIDQKQAVKILSNDQSVLGVVDPRQFEENEDPVQSALINAEGVVCWTAPSADPKHLPRGDKESHRVMKFWVSPWNLPHLQAARDSFNSELSPEQVEQRFSVVGGVARAIFKADVYLQRSTIVEFQEIDDSTAQVLFRALLHQNDSDEMFKKVPQAFLAFYSTPPFKDSSPGCIKVDFLSQRGRLRAGHKLYSRFRTQLGRERDDSGAGMFFERWVGTLLAAGNNAPEFVPFRLCEFTKEVEAEKDIKIPAAGNVLEYANEGVLIDHLQKQGALENNDKLLPNGRVRQPPDRTPVYDFAISLRWFVQVTLARRHPIPIEHLRRLVRLVGATKDDPLHLVFFVLDEKRAKDYSQRGGESYDGVVAVPDITPEMAKKLKELATGDYSRASVTSIAESLELTLRRPAKKRKRETRSLGRFEMRDCALPPYVLLADIMAKLKLVKTGSIGEKWQRLVGFAANLRADDPTKDLQFDEDTVKQHVITLVPHVLAD